MWAEISRQQRLAFTSITRSVRATPAASHDIVLDLLSSPALCHRLRSESQHTGSEVYICVLVAVPV